jgi:hypothetical protein
MFQQALTKKRSFLDIFRHQRKSRKAAMLLGNEILFFDGQNAVRLPVDRKSNISKSECIVVIPEEEIFYKIISVPANVDKDAAFKEAIASSPFQPEDAVLEYAEIKPIAAEPGHKDFAFWIVTRKYLENCRKILETVGLSIQDFLPENFSLVRLLFPSVETNDAALIIAVWPERSVFIAFAGRAIHFSGTLPFGRKSLEGAEDETKDRFLSEIVQAILYYKNRVLHEHGASHHINRILILGSLPDSLLERVALNTQLHVETPGISPELAPLLGAVK